MAIDLRKLKKTYKLTWFDGTEYNLKMPSQGLLLEIAKIEDIEDMDEQLNYLKEIMLNILNTNEEGHVFSDKEFNELSLDIMQVILEDYMKEVGNSLGE